MASETIHPEKIIPIPVLEETEFGKRVKEFWAKIGWVPGKTIDPRHTRMTVDDQEAFASQEIDNLLKQNPKMNEGDARFSVNSWMVISGPSGNGHTPCHIELWPGWLE